MNLTEQQRKALYRLHREKLNNGKGYAGVDLKTLAEALNTSQTGAQRTGSSLVRKGLAVRFVGGVVTTRVYYAASPDFALCPHGCGVLDQHGDSSICPKCGDEWEPIQPFDFQTGN